MKVLTEHLVYKTLSTLLTLFSGILFSKGARDALEGEVSNGGEGQLHPGVAGWGKC